MTLTPAADSVTSTDGVGDEGDRRTVDGFGVDVVLAAPGQAAALRRVHPRPLPDDALATGRIFGELPASRWRTPIALTDQEGSARPVTAMEALEASVLTALRRPPCLVTFSGGMDSTFVLAVALQVARREGLPPVPVSWRFPHASKADESTIQDELLAELGVTERLAWPVTDELDLIGPVASRLLVEHGPVFPANLHLHLPMMELCRGGSVLTGWGGDQVLGAWSRQRWPHPRAVLRSGWSALPPPVRGRLRRANSAKAADYPWLTPASATRFADLARRSPVNGWGRPDRRLAAYRRGARTVEFVRSWDGAGIDSPDIDIEALQRVWSDGLVPLGTELLVQQAWQAQLWSTAHWRLMREQPVEFRD